MIQRRVKLLACWIPLFLLLYLVLTNDDDHEFNIIRIKTNYSELYHDYGSRVDIRIIVLAYNRAESLRRCLDSFQDVVTDGLRVALDVWIDRDPVSNQVDLDTLRVAADFRWSNGPIGVWIHGQHVGLYGQWLYTWRPLVVNGVASMEELALFVEDDVDVSRYGLRWLRALHAHLQDRDDVACYALQDENVVLAVGSTKHDRQIQKPRHSPVYLYRIPGSWAMAPHPEQWRRFQDWYEMARRDANFRPYVKEAPLNTKWYKRLEKEHRQDSMWTMWFIYFMSKRLLFCAYSNLPKYSGKSDVSLSANRKEVGLHYKAADVKNKHVPKLLMTWNASYVDFPAEPDMYDFSGKKLNPYVTARYRTVTKSVLS